MHDCTRPLRKQESLKALVRSVYHYYHYYHYCPSYVYHYDDDDGAAHYNDYHVAAKR
jgi:hypothetical protein